MTATVVLGFKAIEGLSWLAVPAIILLGCWSMARAFTDAGAWRPCSHWSPKTPPFSQGWPSGGIVHQRRHPDAGFRPVRPKPGRGVGATVVGFSVGNSLMFFFGALGALARSGGYGRGPGGPGPLGAASPCSP